MRLPDFQDFPFALLMEDDLSQVHPDLVNFMCKLATGSSDRKLQHLGIESLVGGSFLNNNSPQWPNGPNVSAAVHGRLYTAHHNTLILCLL